MYTADMDRSKGQELISDAIDTGDHFVLAYCYQLGIGGLCEDRMKAFNHWEQAALERNGAQAQCNLAKCYETGKGVAQDMSKAAEWYEKSATSGMYAPAMCALGLLHRNGGINGVKDLSKAMMYFEMGARQGHAACIYNLGECYAMCKDDVGRAFNQFVLAAEGGNAAAQYRVAMYYKKGIRGVLQKSKPLAREWCAKSAAQGYGDAVKDLKKM